MNPASSPDPGAPIGVFDSGVGGLSVLRALLEELPHERFVYVADSGHAPYGERDVAHVVDRSRRLAGWLRERHGVKALVVACNTATAAAIHLLRAEHPELPIVGVEPALKSGVAATHTGHVGVLATRSTLGSAKFAQLLASLDGQARFSLQPCDGLADAIERSTHPEASGSAIEIEALCAAHMRALGPFGPSAGNIDTLVLGCTHYPFAAATLARLAGPGVQLIDTGAPVARQTRRRLAEGGLASAASDHGNPATPRLQLYSTGVPQALAQAARMWLPGLTDLPATAACTQ